MDNEKLIEYDELQREICNCFGLEKEPFEWLDVEWFILTETAFYYGDDNVEECIGNGNFYGSELYGKSSWENDEEGLVMVVYLTGSGRYERVVLSKDLKIEDKSVIESVLDY